MRSLTVDEITRLESQGCQAEDWTRISVADDFEPTHVSRVTFCGDVCLGAFQKDVVVDEGLTLHSGVANAVLSDVTIGDNCLVMNIGSHIHRYDIGEDCCIANVGTIASSEAATYGIGTTIAAPAEAGPANIALYSGLSAQAATLMADAQADEEMRQRLLAMAQRKAESERPERGTIGYGVRIVNTREVTNTCIGDGCEVNGATRLAECTLIATPEAGVSVGADVVMENCVAQPGASATDGARLYNSLLGEACHAGRGFTAESSLFFANSYVDNGEACAAICGPFTVSHHKASLLIATQTSFYNAGSATNFSNHAYKLGALHSGCLLRGAKTGSGSHVLLPARIGAFSVCLGKIESHPDTSHLPFSYVIGTQRGTLVIPGRNLLTVGTWRDATKWPRRDMRPRVGRISIVSHDWLNPAVACMAAKGKAALEKLRNEADPGTEHFDCGSFRMSRKWLNEGIDNYDMALKLYMGQAAKGHFCELPEAATGNGDWTELGAMPLPETELRYLRDDIANGRLDSIDDLEQRLAAINDGYEAAKWSFTYQLILDFYHLDTLTPDDMERVEADHKAALGRWKAALKRDAERERSLGDVCDETIDDFISRMEAAEMP